METRRFVYLGDKMMVDMLGNILVCRFADNDVGYNQMIADSLNDFFESREAAKNPDEPAAFLERCGREND